jgi:hypothetical protein
VLDQLRDAGKPNTLVFAALDKSAIWRCSSGARAATSCRPAAIF